MFKTLFRSVIPRLAVGACLLAIGSGACTRSTERANDPKATLTGYISRSFSVKTAEDRKDLLAYLTGDARVRLERWSDEQFHAAFVESKRKFVRLAIPEIKAVSPKETTVTYEITYVDQTRGSDAKVTSKKLAQMVLDGERWLISDVRNIKELIEFQNELSLP